MYKISFIVDCLNADATLFDLDRYVEYWHTHDTGNSLQEFLGLTDYEYEQWGKSSDIIFRDILRCRREGIDYEKYIGFSDNERIAARSYNEDEIENLKKENKND